MEAFAEIPMVDVGELMWNGPTDAVVEAIGRAAHDIGFFYVTGHGIPSTLSDAMMGRAREFFDLSLDRKMETFIGLSDNHRGYVPVGEESSSGRPDRKESFDLSFDIADRVDSQHMVGPNQWPSIPGFAADVMDYYYAVYGVGCRLIRAFSMAMCQPPNFFDRMITCPPSQLRLMHYPAQMDAHDEPGMGAHTDYECFTLLLATSPGLEVMNSEGVWVDAPPVPGAMVVNIGDMLAYWSGGALAATAHRVRRTVEERYSFPFFFSLDYDTRLRPLGEPEAPGIVVGDHLYAQTVRSFAYLRDRQRERPSAVPASPSSV